MVVQVQVVCSNSLCNYQTDELMLNVDAEAPSIRGRKFLWNFGNNIPHYVG
jgi:hypothetical protein